jgi:elongation factor Ts
MEMATAIGAKDVAALRARTGVGMMDCKRALEDAGGDMEAAIELLRKRLKGKMDERSDRAAAEGVIAVAHSDRGAAMIELRSETDFAARNESFIATSRKLAELALAGPEGDVQPTDAMRTLVDELRITIKENISFARGVVLKGKVGTYQHHNRQLGALVQAEGDVPEVLLNGLCQHVTAAVPMPLAVDESGLPAADLERQRREATEEAAATGKNPQFVEKIAEGKLRKWIDDHTLLGQIYLRELDAKKPVRDYVPKGARIVKFVRYAVGT